MNELRKSAIPPAAHFQLRQLQMNNFGCCLYEHMRYAYSV